MRYSVSLSFIYEYLTFEYKICLHYKPLIFHTEIFGGMFFYVYILGFLVFVRLLDLHVGAARGVLLK
jgi:hypothetical protein